MKIKKGDNVIMLVGKDRGKKGQVKRVSVEDAKLAIEGLNMSKHHLRPRKQGQKGQVISRERLVHIASVALICKSCGKPTRVGYTFAGDSKMRICRKCGAEV